MSNHPHPKIELVRTDALIPNPCNARRHLDAQITKLAFALAENRIPELSTTDKKILNDELVFLFEKTDSFNVTGFSVADIDFHVEVPA